ncbi:MAG: TolC family protein [bacterium]
MKRMRMLFLLFCGAMAADLYLLESVDDLSAQEAARPEAPAPAIAEETSPAGLTGVTLDELLGIALEQSPSIRAAWNAVQAKQSRILPNRTLPDPMFRFQTMGDLIPPTLQEGDPSSARTFGIEQEIPFPGKLGLQGKMAGKEAEAELWSYEQVRREVVAEVKQAYYDYYLVHQAIETVRKDKDLLEKLAGIAGAKYSVGQGIQQDVLKAQVEVSKLIERATVLEQQRALAAARINTLLARPADSPLGRPAEVRKADFPFSLEQLQQLALGNDPGLKMREREIERSRYGVELARREFYPDFSVGFTYFNREEMPEMYGLMAGVKVPLYFWRKQRPELEAARAELAGAERSRESTVLSLGLDLKDAYLMATTSQSLIDLYRSGVIPQARLSLESAVAGYQVGKVDFLTLLDNLITLLEYELRYHEVVTDFQKALARLEPLVGAELTK